jgi:hypothetical protein
MKTAYFRIWGFIIIAFAFWTTIAQAQTPATQPTVSLLAMGDWGNGTQDQKTVADRLADVASKQTIPVNAMLLAGDNFYVPLSGIDDPTWQTLFEKMYDPVRMPMPFYVALGNHDYEDHKAQTELEYAKVHPESRWKLPDHWYRVDFPADHPLVSLLVLDSNKDNLSADQWSQQLTWLETQLAKPRNGAWMMAMAHHTIFSNGAHGDNGVLMTDWGTLFKKYNLDIYLCGHDHDLQHLEIPGWYTSFMLVGGGGAARRPMRVDNRGPFSRAILGFANLVFTPDTMTAHYISGADGSEVHRFVRHRDGTVEVQFTTPSDKATTQQLRVFQGLGN